MTPAAKLRAATGASLLLMFVLLLWRLWGFEQMSAHALRWPFELDYAEGIVWQQAKLMFTPEAYGPIDGFPAIVFHYTPLYHVVTRAVASLTGGDMLYAGRGVSIVSTLLIAAFVGLIACRTADGETSNRERWLIAFGGGLIVFSLYPVMVSAPLMRVDMLAVLLSFVGFWLGLKAFERPTFVHAAALCFVAAIYTKQTSVAAPAALFGVMLWLRPRVALAGIATCVVSGLLLMGIVTWETSGGFPQHIFLYNINRFIWQRLILIKIVVGLHAPLIGVALIRISRRNAETRNRSANQPPRRVVDAPNDVAWISILAYFVVSSLTLITVAKWGSYLNYFVEWLCIVAVLAASALSDAARVIVGITKRVPTGLQILSAVIVPLGIAAQAAMAQAPKYNEMWAPHRQAEVEALAARVRAAPKPVISDEMVMLLRTGKRVLWEPMIFTELVSKNIWDERPFVNRIRNREFAMIITTRDHDETRAVTAAIETAYPAQVQYAEYFVHLPASASQPAAIKLVR
jgi:hypothetical protein